jgi:MFS family permease
MNHATTPHPPAPSGDSKALLVVAGLLLILAGLGCGGGMAAWLMFAWQNVSALAPRSSLPEAQNPHLPGTMIASAALYAGLGLGIAWLGIGAILTRRWAWKLALSAGWLWVLCITMGVISYGFILPQIFSNLMSASLASSPSGGAPGASALGGGEIALITAILVITLMFYLAPAVALIIVFGLKSTRLTCEFRDPKPRWTDAVPVPVLVIWLLYAVTGLALVAFAPFYLGLLPLPGLPFKPPFTSIIWAVVLAAVVFAARDLAAMRRRGWWLTLALVILGGAGAVGMMSQFNLMEMYRDSHIPEEQLKQMEPMVSGLRLWKIPAVSTIILTCYVFWLRRFFAPAPKPDVL